MTSLLDIITPKNLSELLRLKPEINFEKSISAHSYIDVRYEIDSKCVVNNDSNISVRVETNHQICGLIYGTNFGNLTQISSITAKQLYKKDDNNILKNNNFSKTEKIIISSDGDSYLGLWSVLVSVNKSVPFLDFDLDVFTALNISRDSGKVAESIVFRAPKGRATAVIKVYKITKN